MIPLSGKRPSRPPDNPSRYGADPCLWSYITFRGTTTQKFDRTSIGWDAYAKWRNLPQLTEVVSMDSYCVLGEHHLTANERADIAPASEVGPHPVCFRTLECLRG